MEPRLTEAEKTYLRGLIDRDEPLPLAYRERLFRGARGIGGGGEEPKSGDVPILCPVEHFPTLGSGCSSPGGEERGSPGDGTGWTNRLIRGDGRAVLAAALGGPLRREIETARGVRLVYLDPPFATGTGFTMAVPIGAGPEPPTVEMPAFGDAWGTGEGYWAMLRELLRLAHALLAEDGSLYVHCDWRTSARMRLLLDEIFGPERLVNELVWRYGLGNAAGRRSFARKHDTILFYAKSDRYVFHRLRGPVTPAMAAKYCHEDEQGRYMLSYGRKRYLQGGKPLESVWDLPTLGPTAGERVGYPTQKPEALLERIVLASTNPGDLVADLCCGSGTTLAVAERLGRRWLGADAGRLAVQTARRRLLTARKTVAGSGQASAPFEVLEVEGDARPGRSGASGASGRGSDRSSRSADDPLAAVIGANRRIEAVARVDGLSVTVELQGYAVKADTDIEALVPALRPGTRALGVVEGQLVRVAKGQEGDVIREQVTRCWSDWIEAWAVDFSGGASEDSPSEGVFQVDWHAARGGRERGLPLVSAPHVYPRPGTYRIGVQITDPFGCRTTTSITVTVGEEERSAG